MKAFNPFQGSYVPVMFEDSGDAELYCKRKCGQSVAELETLLRDRIENAMLQFPYPAKIQIHLMKACGMDFVPTLIVPFARISGILDAVRTIVLNWALKLEEEGILGEDFSFSQEEVDKALKAPRNINNFYGAVTNSQIQQSGNDSIQLIKAIILDYKKIEELMTQLLKDLDKLQLNGDLMQELKCDIKTVEEQLKSSKPKNTIVKEGLISIRRILEGAGGAMVVKLLAMMNGILP